MECFQELRALAKKLVETLEHDQSLIGDVMLDSFDILLQSRRSEAKQREKFLKRGVSAADSSRQLFSGRGEAEAAILDIIEVSELGQTPNHDGDGGAGNVEAFGDVGHADESLAAKDVADALEIILHALGRAAAVVGAEFGDRGSWSGASFAQ
jgi:hypothetical protein